MKANDPHFSSTSTGQRRRPAGEICQGRGEAVRDVRLRRRVRLPLWKRTGQMGAGFLEALWSISFPAGVGLRRRHANRRTLINCFRPAGRRLGVRKPFRRKPGIYVALMEAAETSRGGGVGYDFSAILPHGALVRGGTQAARAALCPTARVRPELQPWNRPVSRGADGPALRPSLISERFIHARRREPAN